jgi:hypothetical protein
MSFSKFKKIHQVENQLGITVRKHAILPTPYPKKIPHSDLEKQLQKRTLVALTSEKAKSEFIVAPILLHILEENQHRLSLFSGATLEADTQKGLKGECDFLFAMNPHLADVKAPVCILIEAKDDDIDLGLPQCIAQMYAAKCYNEAQNEGIKIIWGCVTTGTEWQFIRLEDDKVFIHTDLIYLIQLPEILGIFDYILR